MNDRDMMYSAFLDELEKISAYQEKEAGIQYLMGAGRALGGMGRAAKQMVQHGAAAGGGGGVLSNLGQAARGGWTRGVEAMRSAGQAGGKGFWGQQKAMAGSLAQGAGQRLGQMGAGMRATAMPKGQMSLF